MAHAQAKVPVIIQLETVFVIPDLKETCAKVNPLFI